MKIKFVFIMLALIASIAFASCSEDEPAKMLWEVSATPSENVKAAFDPSFYDQIQITCNGDGGEVTLKCTNYKTLSFDGRINIGGEYEDSDGHFTAKVIEPGVIKITLEEMSEGFNETKSYLHIKGIDGKNATFTTASINRKP